MISQTERARARELLKTLRKGFDWMDRHPEQTDECMKLIERSDPIIKELLTLGVGETESSSFLLLGGSVDHQNLEAFLDQYEEIKP